jgi:hypothetical protein
VDVSLIGTGGLTVFGAGEAAVRTRFEGMTTDESRMIRLYGIDFNPVTGATSDREWVTIMPNPGPPGGARALAVPAAMHGGGTHAEGLHTAPGGPVHPTDA